MQEFWTTLNNLLRAGQKVFLALVAEHTRHSPGTTGARLLVSEQGTTQGTIGGGIMELRLLERAAEALRQDDFRPQLQPLTHSATGEGEKSGMICAGSQTNLYYLCRPEGDAEAVARAAGIVERDLPGLLTISPKGLHAESREHDATRAPIALSQGSNGWTYSEQLLNVRRIAIIGGGHCCLALSRIMHHLGYLVTVYETREEVQQLRENSYARTIHTVDDYHHAGPMIPYPELTHVVIMTTDMHSDVRGLAGVLSRPFPFIGVMGSKAKLAAIFKDAEGGKVAPEAHPNLHAPVGLPIESHTPVEIAVSVAAQIIELDMTPLQRHVSG